MRPTRSASALLLFLAAVPWIAPPAGAGGVRGGSCGASPNLEAVGTGSGGAFGVPQLSGAGVPDIDTPGAFSFSVTGGVPHAPGILIVARREQPIVSPTFQTTIYTGASGHFVPFVCDANGDATIAPGPTTTPISALCGLDLIAQATVFDFTASGGAAWTNGLRFRFGSL
jgi:hypothetical protein